VSEPPRAIHQARTQSHPCGYVSNDIYFRGMNNLDRVLA
jgi:hypothetical protein